MEKWKNDMSCYDKIKWIECDCHMEAVQIVIDYEEPMMFYFSFYSYGHGNKYGWRYKLRHIWHIIKYGHPYADNIIMREKEIKELIKFLQKEIKDEK